VSLAQGKVLSFQLIFDAELCRIYATPSVILRSSGSVGIALLMWLLGATIAAIGTAVYIELGTVRILIEK
jgi:hypothetical protein